MNTSPLSLALLEAPLLKRGFVDGEDSCNYELYLTEIINASPWMAEHYELPFIRPESESNGECDVYADDKKYGLDFKLIASKTALQARSIFSNQVTKAADGVTFFHPSKCSGKMKATRIAQALRGKTIEELLTIRKNTTKQQGIDNDIKEYLDTLSVSKNLLLFYPYCFKYEKPGELNDDIQTIVNEINRDFAVSLAIRAKSYPALDSFFVFLYRGRFVLCIWEKGKLSLLDVIHFEKSKIFYNLILNYCDNLSEMYSDFMQERLQKPSKCE